jgi:hypothetical protein
MGVIVAYEGSLEDASRMPELVERIRNACRSLGWQCQDVHELGGSEACRALSGVSLCVHPRCDWLHLHVEPDGRFVNLFYWELANDRQCAERFFGMLRENQRQIEELGMAGKAAPRSKKRSVEVVQLDPEAIDVDAGIGYNFVKTQHGGAMAHVAVCSVLRWVKEEYAPNLQVSDDSEYFESGDLARLERELAAVDAVIAALSRGLGHDAGEVGSIDDLVERIESVLADLRGHLH